MFLKDNRYKNIVIVVVTTVVLGLIAYKLIDNISILGGWIKVLISCSMPFVYGIIIAYVLDPLVRVFQRRFKLSRAVAIAITYAVFVGAILLLAIYGIPSIVSNVKEIAANIPSYINSIQDFVNNILEQEEIKNFINSAGIASNIDAYIDRFGTLAVTALEGSLLKVVSISSLVVKFILGLLVSIYVLIDKERLICDFKRIMYLILKKRRSDKILEFLRTYNKMIGTYIGIKAIDSSIVGILAFILLSIVKSEYALLLAVIVGFTNMIPYFGPFIGEIVGFLINVFVSPTKGVMVFLVLFSLQMFDGWYLDPKLIGNKVGVRPFWIIYAVVIGGAFFGPIGMLLASPTAATIKIYYTRLLERNKELINTIDKR